MHAAAEDQIELKRLTLARRKQEVTLVGRVVESMSEEGELPPRGCGLCAIFQNRWKSSGTHTAVGGSTLAKTTTQQRLETAGIAVRARVEALSSRLDAQRTEAMRLSKAGKKTEALAALKRSKATDKQLLTASTTLEALENQILMLEDAALQQQVTSALAASVKSVKKGQKGLLGRVDHAVDGAIEVKDLTDDVSQAFDGLKTADVDEDDLLEELEQMCNDDQPPPAAAVVDAEGTGVSKIQGIEIASYPAAPTKSVLSVGKTQKSRDGEKVQLLSSV
jgi:hypothetical protein